MKRLGLVLMLGLAGAARADLLDEVQRSIDPVKARRASESAKQTREAAKAEEKARKELEKAEARVKAAQEKLKALADEKAKQEKAATQARVEAKRKKDSAHAVAEAARALETAAAMVQKGNPNVEAELDKAKEDKALAEAAQAVGAMASYLKGDSKKVLATLTPEVLTAFPSARRYVGMARLQLGDKDGALKALKEGKLPVTDVEGQMTLGRLAQERKDWETARKAFGNAFTADSTNFEAAMGLARALFATGRAVDAIGPLTVAAADPSNKEANYLLGVASEKANDSRRAELAFANVVPASTRGAGNDPSYARLNRPLRVIPLSGPWLVLPESLDETSARVRLAWYALKKGDHDGALALLAKATRSDALYVRGLAELRAVALDAAHADLQKATELEPKRLEPRCALGAVMLEQGDAATAQETFEFNGDDPLSQVGEAIALGELGQAAKATEKLAKLSTQKGIVGDAAATNLAAIRRASGQGDAAWRALPDKPLTPAGWMLKGMLLVERKAPKDALVALKAAVDAAPNYVDAWVLYSKTLEQTGDDKAAFRAATRALELNASLVEAMAIRARVLGRAGDKPREAAELARIREFGERAQNAAAPSKHTIAVVPFDNNSGDKTLDWMRNGVPEALISDLAHLGSLTIIERTQVAKAFQEQKLQELGFTQGDASKIGKLVGADAVIVGSITRSGDQLRLDGRVLEVGSTRILKTGSATGAVSQIFDIERRLALDLVSEYAAVTSREKVDFFAAKTPSLASLEMASRIRMLSAEGKAAEAKAAYEKLLKDDPKAAEKLKDMQKQWESLAATVAVVPLVNVAKRDDEAWMSVGIAEALTTDLRKVGLFLVERSQVEKLMQERRMTEIFNEAEATKLGKLAGASILFVGSYQVQGNYLRIDGRLVDVSTSQVMQTYTVEGKKDDLFEAESRLVKQVAAALKVDPTKVEKEKLAQGKPSLDDFKRYIQASSKLVVKPAASTEISVKSLAVGALKDAHGDPDPQSQAAVKEALARNGTAPVRVAGSSDPSQANADALVLGTIVRGGGKVRIDLRAVHAGSGEVVASASSSGAATDERATADQAAGNLLSGLGLRKPVEHASGGATPVYKKWWLWTIVGVLVAGGAVGGALGATMGTHNLPHSDATIIAK